MLQPHQRAARIPNGSGVQWVQFLNARFASFDAEPALAFVLQVIEAQSPLIAGVRGFLEVSRGQSLPVVFAFHGELNLESREIAFRQEQPEAAWQGQFSLNGRVLQLRHAGEAKTIALVHEETLRELV